MKFSVYHFKEKIKFYLNTKNICKNSKKRIFDIPNLDK